MNSYEETRNLWTFFPTTHEKMFLEISIWINYIDFDRVIRILNSQHCYKVSIMNTSLENRIINWAVEVASKKVWEIIRLRHYRACQFLSAFGNNWNFEPGKTIELCSNLCSSQMGKNAKQSGWIAWQNIPNENKAFRTEINTDTSRRRKCNKNMEITCGDRTLEQIAPQALICVRRSAFSLLIKIRIFATTLRPLQAHLVAFETL